MAKIVEKQNQLPHSTQGASLWSEKARIERPTGLDLIRSSIVAANPNALRILMPLYRQALDQDADPEFAYWSNERIERQLQLVPSQIQAAREYLKQHESELLQQPLFLAMDLLLKNPPQGDETGNARTRVLEELRPYATVPTPGRDQTLKPTKPEDIEAFMHEHQEEMKRESGSFLAQSVADTLQAMLGFFLPAMPIAGEEQQKREEDRLRPRPDGTQTRRPGR